MGCVVSGLAGSSSGYLSARGHSSSGTRKSGAFGSSYQGGGGGGGGNYGSNDAWDEDVHHYDQDELSHSVGGNTHMSGGGNSASSHYSSSTQPYGNAANPKIAYHNVDAYGSSNAGGGDAMSYSSGGGSGVRAHSPYAHAGRYGRDEYGASSQQPQRGNDRGDAGLRSSRADFSASQYQDRDRDRVSERYDSNSSSSAGGPVTPTKAAPRDYLSPRGGDREPSHASSRHAQSPVVDRVSAALAARAAAESSKSALRHAQQQRNAQTSRHHAGAVTVSPPRVATNHVNVSDAGSRRPPSAGHNGSSSSSGNAGAYSSSMGQSSSTSALSSGAGGDNASMTAAESIRRTQQLLARRGVVAGAADSGPSDNSNAAGGTDRTPTSGRGATKLTETIQHANVMYPPSPQHRHDSR